MWLHLTKDHRLFRKRRGVSNRIENKGLSFTFSVALCQINITSFLKYGRSKLVTKNMCPVNERLMMEIRPSCDRFFSKTIRSAEKLDIYILSDIRSCL